MIGSPNLSVPLFYVLAKQGYAPNNKTSHCSFEGYFLCIKMLPRNQALRSLSF